MENRYTVVCNGNRQEYFFANSHHDYNLGDDWVPVSFSLPMSVSPRPSLPDGLVDTLEKYIMIFHYDEKEIPHPRPDLAHFKGLELYRFLRTEAKKL
jgi:hypothetical protein